MAVAPPLDQPKRKRTTIAVRVTLIAVGVVYLLGIIGYGLNVRDYDELDVFLDTYGTEDTSDFTPPNPGEIWLGLIPRSLDPNQNLVVLDVAVKLPEEELVDGLRLRRTIEIYIEPTDSSTLVLERGEINPVPELRLRPVPAISYFDYPLDGTRIAITAIASAVDEDGSRTPLKVSMDGFESAPGFRVTFDEKTQPRQSEFVAIEVATINRSASVIAVVLLLLAAMALLAILAILVARSVVLRRRQVEATMAGWFAAMMFAIIPLRTNMPGAPPIGVWIDFLVVLWVELLLMFALAVFIMSWLRYGPQPVTSDSSPDPESPAQSDLASDGANGQRKQSESSTT